MANENELKSSVSGAAVETEDTAEDPLEVRRIPGMDAMWRKLEEHAGRITKLEEELFLLKETAESGKEKTDG